MPHTQTVRGGMAATSLAFSASKGCGSTTTSQSTTVYEPGLQPVPSVLGLILLVNEMNASVTRNARTKAITEKEKAITKRESLFLCPHVVVLVFVVVLLFKIYFNFSLSLFFFSFSP